MPLNPLTRMRRAAPPVDPYADLGTDQLVTLARERGIRANARWHRDTIIAKLEGSTNGT